MLLFNTAERCTRSAAERRTRECGAARRLELRLQPRTARPRRRDSLRRRGEKECVMPARLLRAAHRACRPAPAARRAPCLQGLRCPSLPRHRVSALVSRTKLTRCGGGGVRGWRETTFVFGGVFGGQRTARSERRQRGHRWACGCRRTGRARLPPVCASACSPARVHAALPLPPSAHAPPAAVPPSPAPARFRGGAPCSLRGRARAHAGEGRGVWGMGRRGVAGAGSSPSRGALETRRARSARSGPREVRWRRESGGGAAGQRAAIAPRVCSHVSLCVLIRLCARSAADPSRPDLCVASPSCVLVTVSEGRAVFVHRANARSSGASEP